MKQAIRLLARFILTSLLLILVLASLVVLSRYVIGYDPQQASSADVVRQMLAAMRKVFIVSIMISAALSIFSTIRRVDQPFVAVMLLAGSWTVLLVVASLFWLDPGSDSLQSAAGLPEGRIIRVADVRAYSPDVGPLQAAPLLIQLIDRRPGFEVFAEGVVDPQTDFLTIPGRTDIALDLRAVDGSYPAMVVVPERLRPLVRDIEGMNARILDPAPRGGDLMDGAPSGDSPGGSSTLLVVVLGIFLVSCWTPARLTRWPLFNAVLVFLSLRGALWVVNSVHNGQLLGLVTTVVSPEKLHLVSSGVLAFVSLVYVVVLFLLPPISSWKREVGDD